MDAPYREDGPVPTLGPNKKHCHACASILDVRAELCPRCGVRQPHVPGMPESKALVPVGPRSLATTTKNRTAAGIFALVLGSIGIHQFYLGRTAAGVLSLLFCWTFIPALIGFVEGVLFLTMSDEEFAQKHPG